MFVRHHVYMAQEDGESSGSSGAVDRGDELVTPAVEEVVEAVEASEEAEAAEALAAAAVERPRDEGGKFAKKDREDERIPKERFDEAVNKERTAREAAEARAAAAEARVRKEEQAVDLSAITVEIKKLNTEYAGLLLDGKTAEAADVMDKIQQAIEYRAEKKNESSMATATSQAVEQVRWDAAVASLEAKYSVMNPDSADYDQDLTDIVIAEQHRLMQTQGMTASKALVASAEKIASKFMKGVAADEGGARGLAASKGVTDRKAEQVARNLDTAKRQPGDMRTSGKDGDKAGESVMNGGTISRTEFDALPETAKAKLRGDFL